MKADPKDLKDARLGPYTLKKRIGRGGMAEVLLAEDTEGKSVVVKRMLPHLAAEPAYVKLFLREARIAARLRHDNVVRLIDVNREGEDLYLVFDLVDGVSLDELARRAWHSGKAMPVELCLLAIADAAIGLHHAHELKDDKGAPSGLVHRDVSPDNLMIDTAGVTHVLDFGIAKLANAATQISKTGELRGKLIYMSPEQAEGRDIDRRSDLFSLGTTLYWLLTAQRPFTGRTDILTLKALLETDAPAPSSVNPGAPKAADAIVLRLLQKDPARRFATGAELHAALRGLLPKDDAAVRAAAGAFVAELQREGARLPEATEIRFAPTTVPSAAVVALDEPPPAAPQHPWQRSRAPMVGAIAGIVVVVAAVAVAIAAWRSAPQGPSPSPAVDASVAAVAPPPTADVQAVHAVDPAPEADAGGVGDTPLEPLGPLEPLEPLDPRHPSNRVRRQSVLLRAPGGVTWRGVHVGAGGAADVPFGTRSLVAVDAQGGVHEVPVEDGRADYTALPTGIVPVWLPPTGGEVFLGNKRIGVAPIKPLELVVGTYQLRALSGDRTDRIKLVVTPGKNPPVRLLTVK